MGRESDASWATLPPRKSAPYGLSWGLEPLYPMAIWVATCRCASYQDACVLHGQGEAQDACAHVAFHQVDQGLEPSEERR